MDSWSLLAPSPRRPAPRAGAGAVVSSTRAGRPGVGPASLRSHLVLWAWVSGGWGGPGADTQVVVFKLFIFDTVKVDVVNDNLSSFTLV